jgi:hypothetical protein
MVYGMVYGGLRDRQLLLRRSPVVVPGRERMMQRLPPPPGGSLQLPLCSDILMGGESKGLANRKALAFFRLNPPGRTSHLEEVRR